ncbi:MAG: endonuclease IV [Ruminococcaceae bacterium]|nr:endonuclease IV [Oscillospiraceae bacterium]
MPENVVRFGPAGNSESFTGKTVDIPDYILKMGLNAYEYQCGRGVRVNTAAVTEMGKKAREAGIALSLHAPYYISLSSLEEEKRIASVDYILQSARAARLMGATRIIVHSGSCSKISRSDALELAKDTLKRAVAALDEEGFDDIAVCPETMGKVNQLGNLEEVMELCLIDERMIPCIDFGHLNARDMGAFKAFEDYARVFDYIENKLGTERMRGFHSHFSKIEYSAGGEKKHLTFEDEVFGPDFEPVAELTLKKGAHPVFICESDGTQAEDAAQMRQILESKR